MFSPKTVFVLGAGASVDLNLPTGDTLRTELMKVLDRDSNDHTFTNEQFDRAVRALCSAKGATNSGLRYSECGKAAARLRYALPLAVSIDNLLHTHQDDELMVQLGKLAIATVILEKEAASYLRPQKSNMRGDVELAVTNTPNMLKTWYLPLMRLLVTGRTVAEIGRIFENVAFVVFNYDRCLEHFLVNALMNYFHVDPRVAIEQVNKLTIVHPYGQVGHLKWQKDAEKHVVSSFGNSEGKLIEISDQILTFTQSADTGVRQQAKNLILGAETLVFMGFGFLQQNVELLTVDGQSAATKVFVTTKGIGDDDVEIVLLEIRRMIKRRVAELQFERDGYFRPFVERQTCRDLMDRNWLRLTH